MDKIATKLLYYQCMLRLYHWHTPSHARHVAAGGLLEILEDKVDTFVEQLQGARAGRVTLTKDRVIPLKNMTDDDAVKFLEGFRKWLTSDIDIHKHELSLMALRDEIVGDVDKTLYLFTFN